MTLLIGAAGSVQAQPSAATQGDKSELTVIATKETDKLDRLVKLTPEQRTKIYNINLSLAQRTTILEKSDNADKSTLERELETYREEMYHQTLTPEQAATYMKAVKAK